MNEHTMIQEQLVMICSPDISGHLRGKAFPAADLTKRMQRGIGWVPTNIQITTFNNIAETPFGSLGDLLMVPDPDKEIRVDFADGSPEEHFFLGRITDTAGQPWECCLRGQLQRALEALRQETGLHLKSAFEMEFQFLDDELNYGPGFSLSGFREKKAFGEAYLGALRQAGVAPDSFLREWGDNQFEVTMHPALGIDAADHAILMRELARATAQRRSEPVTFTPIRDPGGAGNGVHIHLSLVDDQGVAATYDAERAGGLSEVAGQFVAGVLHHLPAMIGLIAPSPISYTRLAPHRWSAAYNNLGFRDREAAVRICPVAELPGLDVASQFNVEFRAGDSAASPHLQLAAVVFAGLDGIQNKMRPPEPTEDDLSLLTPQQLEQRGYVRLPESLDEALDRLARADDVRGWFGDTFVDVYIKHKRGEMAFLADLSEAEIFRAYEQAY